MAHSTIEVGTSPATAQRDSLLFSPHIVSCSKTYFWKMKMKIFILVTENTTNNMKVAVPLLSSRKNSSQMNTSLRMCTSESHPKSTIPKSKYCAKPFKKDRLWGNMYCNSSMCSLNIRKGSPSSKRLNITNILMVQIKKIPHLITR